MKRLASESSEIKEQNRLVDAWYDQRPVAPTVDRPKFVESDVIFGIGIPLFFLGGGIGFVLMLALGATNPVLGMLLFIGMPFIVGFGIPIGWVIILDLVRSATYRRAMRASGWQKYEQDLAKWRLVGDEDFGKWRKDNDHVDWTLKYSQPYDRW